MVNIQYIVKVRKEREERSRPKVIVKPTRKTKPSNQKAA